MTRIRNRRWDITTKLTEIKSIIKEYKNNYMTFIIYNKLDKLEGWTNFQEDTKY